LLGQRTAKIGPCRWDACRASLGQREDEKQSVLSTLATENGQATALKRMLLPDDAHRGRQILDMGSMSCSR